MFSLVFVAAHCEHYIGFSLKRYRFRFHSNLNESLSYVQTERKRTRKRIFFGCLPFILWSFSLVLWSFSLSLQLSHGVNRSLRRALMQSSTVLTTPASCLLSAWYRSCTCSAISLNWSRSWRHWSRSFVRMSSASHLLSNFRLQIWYWLDKIRKSWVFLFLFCFLFFFWQSLTSHEIVSRHFWMMWICVIITVE